MRLPCPADWTISCVPHRSIVRYTLPPIARGDDELTYGFGFVNNARWNDDMLSLLPMNSYPSTLKKFLPFLGFLVTTTAIPSSCMASTAASSI